MCSLEPNKNFKWIAEEARKNADMTFAVAGSINRNVFSEGLGFELPPNMKLLGFVSDEEANSYSNLVLRKLRINNAGIRTAKNGNGIGIWQPYHQLCTQ